MAQQLRHVDAHAPWLLQLEFTNVLRTACRRGVMTIGSAHTVVDQVNLLPIHIDPTPRQPANLLSLALRLQLPVATRHAGLSEAAWASGVGVLAVGSA